MKTYGEAFEVPPVGYDYNGDDTALAVLVGKTIIGIVIDEEMSGNDRMSFRCSDGTTLAMWHEQDCCESVCIEDVAGDLEDLIGSPMVMAEESMSNESDGDRDESHTWTFYKFGTLKGYVTVRWHGESNGYYSESVRCQWVGL